MTDKARFLKKKQTGGPNLGPTCLNQTQNAVFRHFTEFRSYDFLGITYNDSLIAAMAARYNDSDNV